MKRWTAVFRWALVLYTVALLVATHWPGVTIEGPVRRPDLYVHAAAYGVVGALAVVTRWFGFPGTARAWALATIAGAALGAADELTQPWFSRSADWSDWLADAAGASVGAAAMSALARLRGPGPASV